MSASEAKPIGRVTYIDKQYWGLRLTGGGGDRDAAVDGKIYEKDIVQTVSSQHLSIVLEDGTELVVGPSTRIKFANWNGRDGEGHRIRKIELTSGMLKAKVRKIYSQAEPFVIENRNGVVAVRGTEFVTEAGMGGRLGRLSAVTASDRALRSSEVEVHTIEGEVHLAKDFASINDSSSRVAITAGQTSLVRANMARPQTPHDFDTKRFSTYLAKAVPGVQVNVVKTTTNASRAETAANVHAPTTTGLAQAQAATTNASPQAQSTLANLGNRSVASVTKDNETLTRASDDATHQRRNELAGVAPANGGPQAFANNNNRPGLMRADVGKAALTTDGVRPAFLGGDIQQSSAHFSPTLAGQDAVEISVDTNRNQKLTHPDPQRVLPSPPHALAPNRLNGLITFPKGFTGKTGSTQR